MQKLDGPFPAPRFQLNPQTRFTGLVYRRNALEHYARGKRRCIAAHYRYRNTSHAILVTPVIPLRVQTFHGYALYYLMRAPVLCRRSFRQQRNGVRRYAILKRMKYLRWTGLVPIVGHSAQSVAADAGGNTFAFDEKYRTSRLLNPLK